VKHKKLDYFSRQFLKVLVIFTSEQAIVTGPTPPGTGVILPAIFLTDSKSTSPTIPSDVFIIPTSITKASGFIYSLLINFGTPDAETRISAPVV
jgi:hypothetical protein